MKRMEKGMQNHYQPEVVKGNRGHRERVPFARTTLYCCLAALLAGVPATVLAAPQGGEVVGGTGAISTSGATTLIQQQTSSLAIDWQSFNVAAGETVQFVQPTSTSVVLNRILDQNPSQIFGAIDANGRVFLSNPNGLVFGETAVINAGSFVASGLDISADDFMQGNYTFGTLGVDGGAVINRGLIVAATGGSVTLVGSSVSNEGVILANYGTVNLGAGQTAVIDFDGDGLIRFVVDGAVLSNALGATAAVDNQGQISALGGEILLTAAAAQDIFSRVINNDGLIEAGRIDNTGGVVRLVGIGPGEVISSGTIDVSGQDATSTGGTVQLLGEKVGLFGAATVDVSGQAGGGTVLIGGDREGSNPEIRNATAVYLSQESQVNADATLNGYGGKVVVYADDTARVYGAISAQGGVEGGNGGFVETSGKRYLDVTNAPDVSAPQGVAGEWLIDPYDLKITSSTDENVSVDRIDGEFTYTPTNTTSSLSVDTIYNALYNGTTVTITTGTAGSGAGDILWQSNADLDYDRTGSGTLNLTAHGKIDINSDIKDFSTNGVDSLNLNLTAGGDITLAGAINTNGGYFTASGNAITGTDANLSASSIVLIANNGITLTNKSAPVGNVSLTSTKGDITYNQKNGDVNFGDVTASEGSVWLTNDGHDLTVVGSVTASGAGKTVTLKTLGSVNSDIIVKGTVESTNLNVTLDSSGNIQGGGLITANNTVSLTAESYIGISAQSPIFVDANSVNATSNAGTVSLATSSGNVNSNLNISDISASLVNLNSAGNIILTTSASELVVGNVTAVGSVELSAPSGSIGGSSAALSTTSATISADSSIDLALINSGDVTLGSVSNNGGGINISNVSGDLIVGESVIAGGNGDVLLVTTGSGNILLNGMTTAEQNTVTLASAGDITGEGRVTAETVNLAAVNGMYGIKTISTTAITTTGIQITASNLGVTNVSGEAVIQNSGTSLHLTEIRSTTGGVVDVSTDGHVDLTGTVIEGLPWLTLGVVGDIYWNNNAVAWKSAVDANGVVTSTPFISNDLLSGSTRKLSGLTLRTDGNIEVVNVNVPDLNVGLVADNGHWVSFSPYVYSYATYTLWGITYTYLVKSGPYQSTFNSLSVQADGYVNVGTIINTEYGDLSLESVNNYLYFDLAKLNSAKGIILSSPHPITLHNDLEFNTTSSTEGVIDLSRIDIVSGGGTQDFYELKILAGTGDIVLGNIGVEDGDSPVTGDTKSLGSVYAETTGTVYLAGNINVKGDGIDLGNSNYIVLKDDVLLNSVTGVTNLGWNAIDSTDTPIYSVTRNSITGSPMGPYSLTVNSGTSCTVKLGPLGQAAPVNVPKALSESWGPLSDLTVSGNVAVLYGNITANDFVDLGGVNLTQMLSNVKLDSASVTLGQVSAPDYGIAVVSDTTTLNNNITTGGNIDLSKSSNVILEWDVTLSSDAAVLLNGSIVSYTGAESLTVDAQQGGAQLVNDVSITASSVDFSGTPILGPGALIITATGDVNLFTVGDDTSRVKSLTVTRPTTNTTTSGATTLAGNINTRDQVSIDGAVQLLTDITFNTIDREVDLSRASINGGYDVIINTGNGSVLLGDMGQGGAVDDVINSVAITTTGVTTLMGDIAADGSTGINLLGAPAVIIGGSTSDSVTLTNGNILLNGGTVDGPGGLDIYTGTGTVTLGQIGTTTPLEHLTINGSGLTTFAGNINTGASGDINLSSATNVNFTGNTVITAAIASFAGAVTAARSVDLTNVDIINVSGGTSFTSAGTIAFLGQVNSAGALTVTSTGGNVLLGDIQAGGANVIITASTGDILNNRGISSPENPLNNITSKSLSLNAGNRIGVSTADPIVVSVPEQITLSFGTDMAYIRNMLGSPVYNMSEGVVIDVLRNSLLTAGQTIAMFQNSDDAEEDEVEKNEEEEELTRTVTWLDNTRSPDVPRMIRAPKSWVFTRSNEYVVPASENAPAKSTVKKTWTKESFKY